MRARFVTILSSVLLSTFCAYAAGDFAHCQIANQQLKLVNDYLDPQVRVRAAQSLIQDIETLRPHTINNTSGLPDKLIRLCFDLKRKAFKATFEKGGASLYGSYEFLLSAGKYFFYEKAWPSSHDAFEAASKLKPNLFEPNYYALQAWIFTQMTAEKPVPEEAYRRRFKFYTDNMMKSKDIKPEDKKIVLSYLAASEEKTSKVYTARSMLEKNVGLNPRDLKARLQLGELEERAGRLSQAKKIYEEAIALKVMDSVAEKQIYSRLLRLYGLFGDRAKYDLTLKKAVALYPNEASFKDQTGALRLPSSVKK